MNRKPELYHACDTVDSVKEDTGGAVCAGGRVRGAWETKTWHTAADRVSPLRCGYACRWRPPTGSGRSDRAADRDDEHINNRPSALRAFKEGGTRNTTTRHGAHTGSCTACRRICALLCRKRCYIGKGQQSFRERKDTWKVCPRGGGDARGGGQG